MNSRGVTVAVSALVLSAGLGAGAVAITSAPTGGSVKVCTTKSKVVVSATAAGKCPKGAKLTAISKRGPAGVPGTSVTGPAGPSGPVGPTGAPGEVDGLPSVVDGGQP